MRGERWTHRMQASLGRARAVPGRSGDGTLDVSHCAAYVVWRDDHVPLQRPVAALPDGDGSLLATRTVAGGAFRIPTGQRDLPSTGDDCSSQAHEEHAGVADARHAATAPTRCGDRRTRIARHRPDARARSGGGFTRRRARSAEPASPTTPTAGT